MRLTASILEDFPVCAMKTKLRYFDRVDTPLTSEDIGAMYLGRLAHAGQDEFLRTNDLLLVAPAIIDSATKELRGRLDDEQTGKLIRKACGMVKRWAEFHNPARFKSVMVNKRHILPLVPAIGVFDEYVIQPDRVASDHSGYTLYDWKWVNKLESEDAEIEALRFDLQSAIYQHGLFELGLPVRRVAHVRGLREDPTPFKLKKDGTLGKRRIRNSVEEYMRVCADLGEEPDPEYAKLLLPFFREPIIYRSAHEVEAIWREVVIPRAMEISYAMKHGFTRRMTKFACARCAYRDPCWEGAMGRGEGAFASSTPLPVVGSGASVQAYELS